MIPKGLFTQIGMIAIAVALIIMYVIPTFDEISDFQGKTEVYKTEHHNVASVNAKLDSLTRTMNEVSSDDIEKLYDYMPDTIDEIIVQRDLLLIIEQSEVSVQDISYNEKSSDKTESLSDTWTFDLSVIGDYDQIKDLFNLLEHNKYPLEVRSLSVSQEDDDNLAVKMSLATYSYKENEDIVSRRSAK